MLNYKIIKLRDLTPLHIGNGKENYDFSAAELHSDTISSALAAIHVSNSDGTDIEKFLTSFSISSAFPFWGNNCFLPKMFGKIAVDVREVEEYSVRKRLKRVKYIESGIWSELVKGRRVEIDDEQLNGEFIVATPGFEQFSKSIVNQRVTVPRGEQGDPEPFFFEWKFFHHQAGLYFLIDCEEDTFNAIVPLFEQLGETGLGTDKNIGGGKFNVEVDTIELPDIKDADSFLLLSLYIPTEKELGQFKLSESKFNLLLRGGFMAGSTDEAYRHLRKKSIYMFNVGSVLPIFQQIEGRVVNLKPDWDDERMHPVFRSGRPICIPP